MSETDGVRLVVDPMSLDLIAGSVVDFVESLGGAAFKVENPAGRRGVGGLAAPRVFSGIFRLDACGGGGFLRPIQGGRAKLKNRHLSNKVQRHQKGAHCPRLQESAGRNAPAVGLPCRKSNRAGRRLSRRAEIGRASATVRFWHGQIKLQRGPRFSSIRQAGYTHQAGSAKRRARHRRANEGEGEQAR